jgi:hypothetical protein
MKADRRERAMCCEQLVCAACTSPVAEGRCATCRSARAQLHSHRTGVPVEMIAVLTIVVALLMALAQR